MKKKNKTTQAQNHNIPTQFMMYYVVVQTSSKKIQQLIVIFFQPFYFSMLSQKGRKYPL